jgi:hypothetical protein
VVAGREAGVHRIIKICFCLMLLLALGTGGSGPARASFGECSDAEYLANFDTRFALEPGFLCVESDRVPVHSDAGVTHIRIVQHLLADWATRPGATRAIKDGVTASVRAMGSLGHFSIPDVTVLLVDGFAPPTGPRDESFGDVAAATAPLHGDECLIVVYLLGTGATERYAGSVIAHELFHCIQSASLTVGQVATTGGGTPDGGNWWGEGSADWFATLAAPAPAYMADRVLAFDRSSPTTALTRMSYDGYVFFAWLGGSAHGHESVVPFLRQMAESTSEGAQRSAMSRALAPEEWLRFAEDYIDQRIFDGQGVSIGSTPLAGETLEWTETQSHRVDLEPFVLTRRSIAFRCGRWGVTPRPERFHAVSPIAGEGWTEFPETMDNLARDRGDLRFVGFNASGEPAPLQIAGTLTESCEQCAQTGEVAHNSCLIGTWHFAGHQNFCETFAARLAVGGATILECNPGTAEVTISADGAARARSTGQHILVQMNAGMTMRIDHNLTDSRANWSNAGAEIEFCQATTTMTGMRTINGGGRSVSSPINQSTPMMSGRASFTCTPTTLTITNRNGAAAFLGVGPEIVLQRAR